MAEVTIPATPRTAFGKGAARKIRRNNQVPAVLYGHGSPTRHLTLPGHELMIALRTPNVVVTLSDSTPPTDAASFRSYSGWSPMPIGHQTFG